MALEDIDDYLFKWADLCEPLKDKCLSCGYTDCEYWQQAREEDTEDELCKHCSNFQVVNMMDREIKVCIANMDNPEKCILNRKEVK